MQTTYRLAQFSHVSAVNWVMKIYIIFLLLQGMVTTHLLPQLRFLECFQIVICWTSFSTRCRTIRIFILIAIFIGAFECLFFALSSIQKRWVENVANRRWALMSFRLFIDSWWGGRASWVAGWRGWRQLRWSSCSICRGISFIIEIS